MHMTVSDTVVLSDDAYRTSDVMNDVTNSYHPAPNGTFFLIFTFSYSITFFYNYASLFSYFIRSDLANGTRTVQ